jgi:putative ABC transport system ATP-binding protein
MVAVAAPALSVRGLRLSRPRAHWSLAVDALEVAAGESVFLHGPSGCGKSTLLALIAGTAAGARGEIHVAGAPMHGLSARRRDRLRADRIGIVFQQFNLLPFLTLADNVALPCRFSRERRQRAVAAHGSTQAAAWALLERLGLPREEFLRRPVAELSVGQQQRVAVARALIGAPPLLLADEPTSALDPARRDAFLDVVLEACREHRTGLLMVSHDHGLRARFDRAVAWPEGQEASP